MTRQGSSQTRSPSGFSGPMRTSPIRHSEGLAQGNRRSHGQCGPVVQGSEDLLPHASCSSSLWYQVLGISAGFVPSMPLIFWGVLPRCGSATALIGVFPRPLRLSSAFGWLAYGGFICDESDIDRQRICRIGQLPALQLGHYVLAKPGVAYRIAPVDQSFLLRVADRRQARG